MESQLLGKELVISEHGSPMWSRDETYMKCFLRATEAYLNEMLACTSYLSPETIMHQLYALPVGITDTIEWLENIKFIRYDPAKVLKVRLDRVTEDHSYILIVTYEKEEETIHD